jgi:hypothetical protein
MHVNKVSRIRTIDRVAKDLGEDVAFRLDVAIEMEPEDGLVFGAEPRRRKRHGFTDDGVDSLVDPITIHREPPPRQQRRPQPGAPAPAAYAGRLLRNCYSPLVKSS